MKKKSDKNKTRFVYRFLKITLSGLSHKNKTRFLISFKNHLALSFHKEESPVDDLCSFECQGNLVEIWEKANWSEKLLFASEAKNVLKEVDLQPFWHQGVEDGVDGGVEIVEHTCKQLSLIEL